MKAKNEKAIFSIITIVLIVFIGILVNNILRDENKEVTVAKDFIRNLVEENIIDYHAKDYEVNKDNTLNKLVNKNSQIQYSVLVGNYALDIDKDYNILGFSNKNISNQSNKLKVATYSAIDMEDTEIVDEEKAIEYAVKYIKELSKDEFIFKEVKNKEGEDNPYYVVVFYKCKDGYPIYNQEITALIDKVSWKLQGYSNYPLEDKEYIKDIKIDEEQAIKIVLENFKNLNLNKDNIDIDNIELAYVETEENKLALSYIINIKNKLIDETSENYSVIIRGDNGQVISSNLETMNKN